MGSSNSDFYVDRPLRQETARNRTLSLIRLRPRVNRLETNEMGEGRVRGAIWEAGGVMDIDVGRPMKAI
jgi:hypothetical protein